MFRALALCQRNLSDEGPMLETLDYTIPIGSTPTILYFDFELYKDWNDTSIRPWLPYDWVKPNVRPQGAAMHGKNTCVL